MCFVMALISGTKQEFTRSYNRRVTIEAIRMYGPISRAEISRLTGLTRPTISTLCNQLIEQEIVQETGRRQGQRGQPAIELVMNPSGGFSVGFHVARDHVGAVVVNLLGKMIYNKSYEMRYPSPQETLPLINNFLVTLEDNTTFPVSKILGVGLAFCGPFLNLERKVAYPPDFPQWSGFPIKEELSKMTNLPTVIEHDITAAAIGEQLKQSAETGQNFFFIYIGYGLGGGAIINGLPFRGATGNAAHVGNIVTGMDGQRLYSGEVATLYYLYRMLEKQGIHIVHPEQLLDLYLEKNSTVLSWMDLTVQHLSNAILAIEALLDLEVIYLGGRLPSEILGELRHQVAQELQSVALPNTSQSNARLLQSKAGKWASAIGAASLPIYENLSPRFEMLQSSEKSLGG